MKFNILKRCQLSIPRIFKKIPFLSIVRSAVHSAAATEAESAKLPPVVPVIHSLPDMSDGFFQQQKFSNIPHLCAGSYCSGPYSVLPAVLAAHGGNPPTSTVLDGPLPPQCVPSDNLLRPCWKCRIFMRQMRGDLAGAGKNEADAGSDGNTT